MIKQAITLSVLVGAMISSAAPSIPAQIPTSQEWMTSTTLAADGRALILSTRALPTTTPVDILIFACPNGNTMEQTAGDTKTSGTRWRYGIQHIAAQWRYLHETGELGPGDSVLAIVEAPGLSWPSAMRQDGPARTARLFGKIRSKVGPQARFRYLAAHSGGGALLHAAIAAATTPTLGAILPEVQTIAFLDANYAFQHPTHGNNLARWLHADKDHRLIALAYDDRNIELNGKRVVGPTGGTLRANLRMEASLTSSGVAFHTNADVLSTRTVSLDEQVRIETIPNPDNRILHTVLVERNGLIHALTPNGSSEWMKNPVYRGRILPLPRVVPE